MQGRSFASGICLILMAIMMAASAEDAICTFHRNGQFQGRLLEVDLNDPANQNQLRDSILPIAKALGLIRSDAPSEFEIRNSKGEPVSSIFDCHLHQNRLFLLRVGELWFYPGLEIGHTEIIKVENRNVTARTLSVRPRILLLENFFRKEEADGIIETSEKNENFAAKFRVRERIAEALRIPRELVFSAAAAEVKKSAQSGFSSTGGLAELSRNFFIKKDSTARKEELELGRNIFVSVKAFLNTIEDGEGGLFFPFVSDETRKMVKLDHSGSLLVTMFPSSRACEPESGLLIQPKAGDAVVIYTITAENQMQGKPDLGTLYQYCNPLTSARWVLEASIYNKQYYSSEGNAFMDFLDQAFNLFFGTDFTKSVLMNGYGWDWAENPKGTYSHKVQDIKGKHRQFDLFHERGM